MGPLDCFQPLLGAPSRRGGSSSIYILVQRQMVFPMIPRGSLWHFSFVTFPRVPSTTILPSPSSFSRFILRPASTGDPQPPRFAFPLFVLLVFWSRRRIFRDSPSSGFLHFWVLSLCFLPNLLSATRRAYCAGTDEMVLFFGLVSPHDP